MEMELADNDFLKATINYNLQTKNHVQRFEGNMNNVREMEIHTHVI